MENNATKEALLRACIVLNELARRAALKLFNGLTQMVVVAKRVALKQSSGLKK
jgi:hypothetical protein